MLNWRISLACGWAGKQVRWQLAALGRSASLWARTATVPGVPFHDSSKSPRADPAQADSLKHANFHPKTLQAKPQFVCWSALRIVTRECSISPTATPVAPITGGVFVSDGSAGSWFSFLPSDSLICVNQEQCYASTS